MPYEIAVDRGKCIGCQNCANVCPAMFRMKGEKAEPIKKKVRELGCAKQAESECPVQAITVREA